MSSSWNTSGLRDNYTRGCVADFLKATIKNGSELSVVSAYFTIYAYEALKGELDSIERLNFLFGEPTFIKSLDPEHTDPKAYILSADGLALANKLQQKRIAKECADWIEKKVNIKTVRQSNLLHGKMYHIANGPVEEAIVGSSNFTVRGLGLGEGNNNIELNLIVDGNRDRRELKQWFDELWNSDDLVKDVKNDILEYLSRNYRENAPEFIYFKTLFHLFNRFLDDTGKTDIELGQTTLLDSQIYKALYPFQRDGVKGAINKVRRHGGCIIADSVGLGKTFEALAIIKYFELRNDRVLVLCPKKLRENWTVYRSNSLLNPFPADRFRFDVLSHTDLSRNSGFSGDTNLETHNWGNYDLIVIDESHNFRNSTPGKRDDAGNIVRKSRYQRLMDDIIKSGVRTNVILLSATPVNNDLKDLRNQIYFVTEGKDNAFQESLGIGSLTDTLATAQKTFTQWARKQAVERKTNALLESLSTAFFTLLDELTIARSRKHITRFYKDSIKELGGFPKRERPISVYPAIDTRGRFLSYDKLNDEIEGYSLSLFNPATYVKEEFRPHYQSKSPNRDPFSQADRETFLIGMMKVNFLKRLESSVKSFEITMERTIGKIERLERKINKFLAGGTSSEEDNQIELDLGEMDEDEAIDESELVGGKFKYELKHMRLKDWLKDLKKDKDQLTILLNAAQSITPDTDAKLQELKCRIGEKVKNPTTTKNDEPNRKVLVFTAFSDTATYLYNSLVDWARNELGIHVALVCGGGQESTTFGERKFDHILTNFSPRAKSRDKIRCMLQDGEIDLIIATDCISEGQNLQDCDHLINYDIHWNPVRIIQRFGRIDRIGSVNKSVQLVNFWPTDDLNKYINLKNRVEARMALVDLSATFEDNILESDEIEELIHADMRYRDKQLLRLREEVLDLEDFNESVSLSEFTLDDFRLELLNYIEANRPALESAPFGLYAIVPPHPDYPIIGPGVIFCLHQRSIRLDDKPTKSEKLNPLKPFFLVYVLDSGDVRFSFAQPKQILEIYRILCANQSKPYEELCKLFEKNTDHGRDMSHYDALLKQAVKSVAKTFQKRAATGLQGSRDFILPEADEQVHDNTELDLVTWLVIKQP